MTTLCQQEIKSEKLRLIENAYSDIVCTVINIGDVVTNSNNISFFRCAIPFCWYGQFLYFVAAFIIDYRLPSLRKEKSVFIPIIIWSDEGFITRFKRNFYGFRKILLAVVIQQYFKAIGLISKSGKRPEARLIDICSALGF